MRSALAFVLFTSLAAAAADESVDLAVVHRIKNEAFKNGQVMDHLFWLTDVNGPRLTNSPGYKRAAEWAKKRLEGYGASDAHLEGWGKFGRGWTLEKFSMSLVAPVYTPLAGVAQAWSGGTDGLQQGEPILAPLFLRHERDERFDIPRIDEKVSHYIEKNRGKLKGRIVLLEELREVESPKEVASTRLDEKKLADLAQAPEIVASAPFEWPLNAIPADPKKRRALFAGAPMEVLEDFFIRRERAFAPLWKFFADEGALAVLLTDERGDGGLVFAESAGRGWEEGAPTPPPVIVLPPESYNRLVRLDEKKVATKLELDVKVRFNDDEPEGMNVVADIPGSSKKDEFVMLGAHLDSWHGGTGATDNGAGSAVMIEAFRILRALKLPMARSVRIALWSGEEQGLHGSRGYVKKHFGDPATMELKSEQKKVSAYFNVDNGTGKIRGVYLQNNDMVRPIFEKWLMPFRDLGATTLTIRNTGGTDHLSFDAIGIPGFQFIQDPLDYQTRTHHSDMDVYEHAQPGDLMQAAAIVASFVYDAANRAEMLPRKPLNPPLPERKKEAQPASAQ
jgi:hypothetical protein